MFKAYVASVSMSGDMSLVPCLFAGNGVEKVNYPKKSFSMPECDVAAALCF